MIQRKQTLFLLVAVIVGIFHIITDILVMPQQAFSTILAAVYSILAIGLTVISIVTIGLYWNLRIQAHLCRIGAIVSIILLLLSLDAQIGAPETEGTALTEGAGFVDWIAFVSEAWKWIVTFAALLLALRGVNADRELLASIDRIR